ncbi:hypothetical protein HYC85_026688 [Camellia sinensis]|uniref:Protein kinase domain-containing protein n=1 Tax=Camellia sinensis TaxID=4442 RepID=A0A7J7G4A9_CAMSI|nr:hypothetical protein HYC85_026688 [Camellia sinensis]
MPIALLLILNLCRFVSIIVGWLVKLHALATIFRIDEGFAKATCNFTTLIGQGAFGLVYKDQMLTSETIVVKMLATDSKQEAKEFQTELAEAAKAQFSHDYSDHLALMRVGKKLKETSLDMNTAGRIFFLLNQ